MTYSLLKMKFHVSDVNLLDSFSPSTPARSLLPATPYSQFFLSSTPTLCITWASRQSWKIYVSFIIRYRPVLDPSFRVSICVWRMTLRVRQRIRGEGEEGGKRRRRIWKRDDSERGRNDDVLMMIEKKRIQSREGADDEKDKVKVKKTLFSIFSDFLVVLNIYFYNIT